ncbi:MAG: alpha/beta hydrolase [Acidobacteriaceae bacterium]|nr:alpha/beta hydrolase [Acidobacteriaceae bacterium]
MPYYHSSGVKLHYMYRGPAPEESSHPVMVFLHGIGGDVGQPARFLHPERTGISEEALSIVHLDFRGHGQSELGPVKELSIATLARDLEALLDHLEICQAVVGGISMGAAVALRFAVNRPHACMALILSRPAWAESAMSLPAREALVLVATLLAEEDWRSSADEALARSRIFRAIEEVCSDSARSIRGHILSVLSRPECRASSIAYLQLLPFSKCLDDLERDLARVDCPAVILAAEGDPIHPFGYARRIAQCLPNCELVQIAPKSAVYEMRHLQEVDGNIGAFLRSKFEFQACNGALASAGHIKSGERA